jgi:murein DD-endopeptidase MepM/ murein hydrolase activator NlpD
LNLSQTASLKISGFTEFLIRENDLAEGGFERWAFCPGMLFNGRVKWWGDRGRRDHPHEGLDLCLYLDRRGQMRRLSEKTRIPAMYDGLVAAIADDILGQSVIVEHQFFGSDADRICSIYAHTRPQSGLQSGTPVKAGDIIAAIADASRSKAGILPHLHISLARLTRAAAFDRFDWQTINRCHAITWLDPLPVIGGPYQVLEDGGRVCREL